MENHLIMLENDARCYIFRQIETNLENNFHYNLEG